MQRRNRYLVTLAVSVVGGIVWLLTLKDFANYTIAHPVVTNLFGVFVLAVGGGVFVATVPGIIWNMLTPDEDAITGETE